MAKIAAFYYSQTGQSLDILQSLCGPIEEAGHEIIRQEIVPTTPYPFPWTGDSFFQAFPESRMGIAPTIKALDLETVKDADLVIIAFQAWFLSPSLPIHGFFHDEAVKQFLQGKAVVTIDGCRNMWLMAHVKVLEYLDNCGSRLVGNIVMQDRHHNLLSVITIVRWLLYGRKERSGIFPAAGVSQADIDHGAVFGQTIAKSLADNDFTSLQRQLMQQGAIDYKPAIVFIEKTGHRIFGIWAKFILRKGGYGAPARTFRLRLFKYYLFAVLYLISPIGLLVFHLTRPFRIGAIRRDKQRNCYLQPA